MRLARMRAAPRDFPLRKRGKNLDSGERVVSRRRKAKTMAEEPTRVCWPEKEAPCGLMMRKSVPPKVAAVRERSQKVFLPAMCSIFEPRRRMAVALRRRCGHVAWMRAWEVSCQKSPERNRSFFNPRMAWAWGSLARAPGWAGAMRSQRKGTS